MIIEKRREPREPKAQVNPRQPQWDFASNDWDPEPDIKMVELCPVWVAAAFIFVATVITVVFLGFLNRVTWG